MTKIITGILLLLLFAACKQQAGAVFAPEYLHPENGLQVITSLINNKDSTLSVIYGNRAARAQGRADKYVMVTAHLRRMPQWYGTNMNGEIICIETLTPASVYDRGAGYTYTKQNSHGALLPATDNQAARIAFIISQPAAVYP